MIYEVIAEEGINNQEFEFYLESGYRFADGDFEPDLVAQWLAAGWVEVVE